MFSVGLEHDCSKSKNFSVCKLHDRWTESAQHLSLQSDAEFELRGTYIRDPRPIMVNHKDGKVCHSVLTANRMRKEINQIRPV